MGNHYQPKSDSDRLPKRPSEGSTYLDVSDAEPTPGFAFSPAVIMKLQRTIGNRAVQRLMMVNRRSHTGNLIQTNPDPTVPTPMITPESTPTAEPPPSPQSEPDEIEIVVGTYIGRPEFHSTALPKNQYYANHPPQPGWPYSDRLKALWEAEQYHDFADEVAGFQVFTLKLPEAQVDGILGPKTSRKLIETIGAEVPPLSADESSLPPSAYPDTVAPPSPEPTPGTSDSASDAPAVENHPMVAHILTPVERAFPDKATKVKERRKTHELSQQERSDARARMAAAREQVAGLKASDFASEEEMKRVKAYINQRLNALTIFYTQQSNANILWGQGNPAKSRTCNMTMIAMLLEALGKSSENYNGGDLRGIATNFSTELGGVNISTSEDLASLRLPDFLQLVAIDVAGSREKAAGKVTSHEFITTVIKRFGLHLTEIKGGQVQARKEEEKSFLRTRFTDELEIIGSVYRPAKGDPQTADERRQQFAANVDTWIEIDTQTQKHLNALQTVVNNSQSFDSELQARTDDTINQLEAIHTGIAKGHSGKSKQLKAIIETLKKARANCGKKSDKPPKQLQVLFDGKGKEPLRQLEANLTKYARLKHIYETLGEEGGIEAVLPLDQYKASIIPTMEAAISAGNQVMVNLYHHFVRLQSISETGIVIDDPGSSKGEDLAVTWEDARKDGYFEHYLLVSR